MTLVSPLGETLLGRASERLSEHYPQLSDTVVHVDDISDGSTDADVIIVEWTDAMSLQDTGKRIRALGQMCSSGRWMIHLADARSADAIATATATALRYYSALVLDQRSHAVSKDRLNLVDSFSGLGARQNGRNPLPALQLPLRRRAALSKRRAPARFHP